MGVSVMFSTEKKQFGIWVFLEVQEINFLGLLSVNMNIVYIVYFYMNSFGFVKKFLPLLTMHAFFRNTVLHHNSSIPNDIFNWFLLVDIQNYAALLKKPAINLL